MRKASKQKSFFSYILVLWLSIQCFSIVLHKQQKDKKKLGYEVLYEIKEHGKVLQYRNYVYLIRSKRRRALSRRKNPNELDHAMLHVSKVKFKKRFMTLLVSSLDTAKLLTCVCAVSLGFKQGFHSGTVLNTGWVQVGKSMFNMQCPSTAYKDRTKVLGN